MPTPEITLTEEGWLIKLPPAAAPIPGTPGMDAYQIAQVEQGFTGTRLEWLASLKVKGDTGPAGMGASVPGGRLTLASGHPVMKGGADYSGTVLYYAPFESDKTPLFDGTNWGSYTFTSGPTDTVGASMVGGAAWAANTARDVFLTLVGGVARLATGPAWPADTLSSRGLARRNGLYVNAGSLVLDLSPADQITVSLHQATWVGSINVGATAGLLTALLTLGQNRRCDVWNLYHQQDVILGVGCPPDPPAQITLWCPSQPYTTGWQAFNNSIDNSGYYFTGLPQDVSIRYLQRGFVNSLNFGYCAFLITVCKNTLSNIKGTWGSFTSDTTTDAYGVSACAEFLDRASVGVQRAIMGTANANGTDGATMWGLTNNYPGRYPEDAHVMWIKYLG